MAKTKTKASAKKKATATKSASANKKATATKSASAKKKATAAKKAASAKKPSAKKATAKKATAKKAAAKKATAKKATAPKTPKPRGPAAAEPSAAVGDAAQALDEIAFFVRTGEDPGERLHTLLERLHAHADATLLPAMFGLLDDEDTSGLLWPVFYVAEEQGDAYLQALVGALPLLQERAPGWAEIAVLRILNTRGEPEDCTAAFDRIAAGSSAAAKAALQRILSRMLDDADEPLTADQRASVKTTLKAIGKKTH